MTRRRLAVAAVVALAVAGCDQADYTACGATVCPAEAACCGDRCVAVSCLDQVLDEGEECLPGQSVSCYGDAVQYGDFGRVLCTGTCQFNTEACGVFGYRPETELPCSIPNPVAVAEAAGVRWVASGRNLVEIADGRCTKTSVQAIKQVVAVRGGAVIESEPNAPSSNVFAVVEGGAMTTLLTTTSRTTLGDGVAVDDDVVLFGRSGSQLFVIDRTTGAWAARVVTVTCAESDAPPGMRIDGIVRVPGTDWIVLGMRRTAAPFASRLAVVARGDVTAAGPIAARCQSVAGLVDDSVFSHGLVIGPAVYFAGTSDAAATGSTTRLQRLAVVRIDVDDAGTLTSEVVLSKDRLPPVPLPSSAQFAWVGAEGELTISQNNSVVAYGADGWFVPPPSSERLTGGLAVDDEVIVVTPARLARSRGLGYRVPYDCRQEPGAIASCSVLTAGAAGGQAWALVSKRNGVVLMRDGVEAPCDPGPEAQACAPVRLAVSATAAWGAIRRTFADGRTTIELADLTRGLPGAELEVARDAVIEQLAAGAGTVAVLIRGAAAPDDVGRVWHRPTSPGSGPPTMVEIADGRVEQIGVVASVGGDVVVALVQDGDAWSLRAVAGAVTFELPLPPTVGRPRAVAGADVEHLWVTGDNGMVLACAAAGCADAWTSLGTDSSLTVSAGTGAGDLFVGGVGNALFRFDGDEWSAIAPPPLPADIASLWVDPADLSARAEVRIAAGPEIQSLRLERRQPIPDVCE